METLNHLGALALRPRDAAKALGISSRTLWELSAPRGPIPCVRVGHGRRKSVLYPVDELRAWLRSQAAEDTASPKPKEDYDYGKAQ